MKLYEIANEYEEILNELYDEYGNVNQQALARLEQNDISHEKKAIAVASFIKNLDAERKAIDDAKKAMANREKTLKNRVDELEIYLQMNMERRGIFEIKCPYFVIKLKKCPHSVEILNEDLIPAEYKRTVTEVKPDKLKMREEMMEGVIIEGARLKQDLRLDIR